MKTIPPIVRRLLALFNTSHFEEGMMGDFEEFFHEIVQERGLLYAHIWSIFQVIRSIPRFFSLSCFYFWILLISAVKITWRRSIKEKGYFLITIFSLILGMSIFLGIMIYVHFECTYDQHITQRDHVFRLIQEKVYPDQTLQSAVSAAPAGPTLKTTFPEVTAFSRYAPYVGQILLSNGEHAFYERNGVYVDPDFLSMFSIRLISGNPAYALENPNSIIITRTLAQKYFGAENPMGKILQLENFCDLTVTGVMEDGPDNSHLHFDFLTPFILQQRWGARLNDWNNWGLQYTYIQLDPKTDTSQFQLKISRLIQDNLPESEDLIWLQPLRDIHLGSVNYDNYADIGSQQVLVIVASLGLFILLIAVINFVNLSSARQINRVKECGLRMTFGAGSKQIKAQLFVENFVLVAVSQIIAILIILLLMSDIRALAQKPILLNLSNPIQLLITLSGTFITVILSSLYPSIKLSSISPARAFQSHNIFQTRKGIFRKILVFFQFGMTIFLLFFTLIMQKQVHFLLNRKLGIEYDHVLYMQMRGGIENNYETLKQQLLQLPHVKSVSAGSSPSTIYSKTARDARWEGKSPDDQRIIYASLVDFDFLNTFQIKLIEGRDFSKQFPTDRNEAFLINQKAREMLGFETAVGRPLTFDGKEGRIIGVVEDYHFLSLRENIKPLIMTIEDDWLIYLFIRISDKEKEKTIHAISDAWKKTDPNVPFQVNYMERYIQNQYTAERLIKQIVRILSILALIIATLGLLGVTAFLLERRTKEIGIRKVLGASTQSMTVRLIHEFLLSIVLANLIALPLAWLLSHAWLHSFAFRIDIQIQDAMVIVISTLAIGFFTVIFHIHKSVRKNPVDVLRWE